MVRLYHDDIWSCNSKLDCVLYGYCLLQIRRGHHACAPYPGAPNYQVPAIKYEVDINKNSVWLWEHVSKAMLSWNYSYLKLVNVFTGVKHDENKRMQDMHTR